MAWIETHQQLFHHPKTKRASRALGLSIPAMAGHLIALWLWCMDYAKHGDLSQYTNEEIADAAMWEGDAATFYQALVECKWLEATEDKLLVHDWFEYGGKLTTEKEKDAARKRADRASKPSTPSPPQPNNSIPDASDGCPPDGRGMSAVEKKREEEKRDKPPPPPAREARGFSSGPGSALLAEFEISSHDPVFMALQEVTGWLWGTKLPRHDQELLRSAVALRGMASGPPATAESVREFGRRWREEMHRTSPAPGQVISSWVDVLDPPSQGVTQIGTSRNNTQPVYQSQRDTAAASRRALKQQYAEQQLRH